MSITHCVLVMVVFMGFALPVGWSGETPADVELVMFQGMSELVVIARITKVEERAQERLNRRAGLEILKVLRGDRLVADARRNKAPMFLDFLATSATAAGMSSGVRPANGPLDGISHAPPLEDDVALIFLHPQYEKKGDADYGCSILPFGAEGGYGYIRFGKATAEDLSALKKTLDACRSRVAKADPQEIPDAQALKGRMKDYYAKASSFAEERVRKAAVKKPEAKDAGTDGGQR